ncbi:MAG: MBL fold metallo-hydrolase [Planctomycetota bacterium]|nr:MBL fold metallo-hydrolase [Planctomycetota bacterium]
MIRLLPVFLLLLVQVGCHGTGLREVHPDIELVVLGIAQDGGVPHLGCQKDCCISARRDGTRLGPACLAIVDHRSGATLLVEATPAIEEQLSLLREVTGLGNKGRRAIDSILLTHAHIGHYTGLIQFGREVASTDAVDVYCTERMGSFLEQNGPWSQLIELKQIVVTKVEHGFLTEVMPGVKVRAISVKHRDEFSDTVAWRIEGPSKTVLFCPDIDRWDGGVLENLIDGVDVCYLDATFYDGRELPGRDLSEIPHPPMVVTMEKLQDSALREPGRFRFIHLNHTNPALTDTSIRSDLENRGFRVAKMGERFGL